MQTASAELTEVIVVLSISSRIFLPTDRWNQFIVLTATK